MNRRKTCYWIVKWISKLPTLDSVTNSRQEASWIRFAVAHRMRLPNFSRVNDRHIIFYFLVSFFSFSSFVYVGLCYWFFVVVVVYREEIRRTRSRCLVAGSHFVYIGERLAALRRVHSAGAERARPAGKISYSFLHVDWLRKSTQEVSRSKSDEASIAWGECPCIWILFFLFFFNPMSLRLWLIDDWLLSSFFPFCCSVPHRRSWKTSGWIWGTKRMNWNLSLNRKLICLTRSG